MKLNSLSVSLGLVATATLSAIVAPGQASAFSLGNGVTSVGGALTVTQATTFNFAFQQSRGLFTSSFGIYSAANSGALVQTLFTELPPGFDPGSSSANDWLGTAGVTVLNPTASVLLGPGTYYFGLTGPGPTSFTSQSGNISSASGVGATGLISNASSYTFSAVGPNRPPATTSLSFGSGNFFVAMNDSGSDQDVQDFIVSFSVVPTSVPEPSLLLGMGLVAGGIALSRRKAAKA